MDDLKLKFDQKLNVEFFGGGERLTPLEVTKCQDLELFEILPPYLSNKILKAKNAVAVELFEILPPYTSFKKILRVKNAVAKFSENQPPPLNPDPYAGNDNHKVI